MSALAILARQVDDKRRITMPDECPPGSAVDLQQVDAETWIVKLHKPRTDFKVVLIPAIDKLPDDPAWEKKEASLAAHLANNMPPIE
jgi:hypothetical protein